MDSSGQYDKEIANTILSRLRDGESLSQICRDEDMPSRQTFWRWTQGECGAPRQLADEYARARTDQANAFAEDVINIADDIEQDAIEKAANLIMDLDETDPKYEYKKRAAIHIAKTSAVESARVRIDARKWTAARMHPNLWGDRISLQHTTPPNNPLQIQLTDLSDEQLEKIAALQSELSGASGSSGTAI